MAGKVLEVVFVVCMAALSSAAIYSNLNATLANNITSSMPSSRQKRFLYYTTDRRLAFPRGSAILLGTTFILPTLRNLPGGYSSKMTVSLPWAFDLDALYWTSDQNPYGLYPDLAPVRKKRSIEEFGSTQYLYNVVETAFEYFGHSGRGCLKRAICELRQGPLNKSYGWLKRAVEWLLTPSVSNNDDSSSTISEYLEAEYFGRQVDCGRYVDDCPIPIFSSPAEKEDFSSIETEDEPHSRQKRLIFMTGDRTFALPPSTGVSFSFTFNCPLLQYPPLGWGPELQFSVPLDISFDEWGWTSEDNPYGTWPDLSWVNLTKVTKREIREDSLGTTSHLYATIASIAEKLGYPGQTCLQRAICEMQEGELAHSYGWLKRLLEWLLTPSKMAEQWEHLSPYREAEMKGQLLQCYAYYHCTFSLFQPEKTDNHRRRLAEEHAELHNEILDFHPKEWQEKKHRGKKKEEEEHYMSLEETIKIHAMVDRALRSSRLGARMYTDIS